MLDGMMVLGDNVCEDDDVGGDGILGGSKFKDFNESCLTDAFCIASLDP
jgi:hypothetical protein